MVCSGVVPREGACGFGDRMVLFKQKTAYEISGCLVGSDMCIRVRYRMDDFPEEQ